MPTFRTISDTEWKRHSNTINHLYHVDRLRLYGKEGQKSVQQVMRDHYGFDASVFQYEKYLRKQERPKNLKKEEWKAIGTKLRELHNMGFQTRVKISGQVCSKEKVNRALRNALPDLDRKHHGASGGLVLPSANRAVIETRKSDDDEWLNYVGENNARANVISASTINLAVTGLIEPSDTEPIVEDQTFSTASGEGSASFPIGTNSPVPGEFSFIEQMSVYNSTPLVPSLALCTDRFNSSLRHSSGPTMLPLNEAHSISYLNLNFHNFGQSNELSDWQRLFEIEDTLGSEALIANQSSTWELAPLQVQSSSPDIGTRSTSLEVATSSHAWNSALDETCKSSLYNILQSLLTDAVRVSRRNSKFNRAYRLPDINELMSVMTSCIPDCTINSTSGLGSEMDTRGFLFDSPVHTAILWSIANGFAGLETIPRAAILKILIEETHMDARLFHCLQTYPPALARTLAENLFRLAIEALDAQAVREILQTTHKSRITINPDNVICKINGINTRYTPIEFAAMHQHIEIVQLLVDIADINKTYSTNEYDKGGALGRAVTRGFMDDEKVVVDLRLIKNLLDHKAEIRPQVVGSFITLGQEDLISELVSRPATHHHFLNGWDESTILLDVASLLRNSFATEIIQKIFRQCRTEHCINCIINNQNAIDTTFYAAARRGNLELVEFLLPYTQCKDAALSAAIRSGHSVLIELMFKEGARIDVPAHRPYNVIGSSMVTDERDKVKTTPLAEAIRSQNDELLQELEILGAISCLGQAGHFEAAMIAAAEVGDYPYMQKIFDKVQVNRHGSALSSALYIVMLKNNTEAAQFLISNGANTNEYAPPGYILRSEENYPLVTALRKQNRVLFNLILEDGISPTYSKGFEPGYKYLMQDYAMEAAGLWGDISIIDDLIFAGADINSGYLTTALGAAAKKKNMRLVRQLLERGASLNKGHATYTPLSMAAMNGDDEMIAFLFSKGADPADNDAFLSALKHNNGNLENIFHMFSKLYPEGIVGFGADLLVQAITKDDRRLLSKMLRAKFDPNTFRELTTKEADTWKTFVIYTPLGLAITNCRGSDFRLIQELINHGGNPNSVAMRTLGGGNKRLSQETALMVAIRTMNVQMVEMLLNNGADPQRPARKGIKRTPLQLACEVNSFEITQLLLGQGAERNERPADMRGGTALQLTAMNGNIKIAKLLLEHGASIHELPSQLGARISLEGAAENGRIGMIALLWNESQKSRSAPFSPQHIQKAISLAKEQGHNGCAEYITSLWSAASVGNLLL